VSWLLYAIIGGAVAIWLLWAIYDHFRGRKAGAVHEGIVALGDDAVPASIHPQINPNVCIGSGSCVRACPEKQILGMIDGKAKLVNPLACVGHGACAASCPVEAITLVFGTARRGVDLPKVKPDFETNQPGIYIAGELGGMGLIRNAIEQGKQAAQNAVASGRRGPPDGLDAVVVGAGPAGISAALQFVHDGLRVELLEQEVFGGTIRHYPRAKIVMTGVLDLPRFGKVKKRTMSKEGLVELWEEVREQTDLPVRTGERVESIKPDPAGGWRVKSTGGERRAANVVLAMGRRGAPRKLGVPGEELDKVSYRLLEPEPFAGKHVLIVGGGNAAADCAVALVEARTCKSVTLSYRRPELARLRAPVKAKIDHFAATRGLQMLLPSEVVEIKPHSVRLTSNGTPCELPNDAVIVQIGGTSPMELLGSFGIETITKRGEA
jgi:thioredoxin reductase/NAD-dependent dihydropyrimidine dehydrogenase PreA subunit